MTEDTHQRPFMGKDADEVKERLKVQHQMVEAIEQLDFTNNEHWSVQLAQGDQHCGCWIMCEQTMLPAVAGTLVQTLTRVIQMADEHGPDIGAAARVATMQALQMIDFQQPQGEC